MRGSPYTATHVWQRSPQWSTKPSMGRKTAWLVAAKGEVNARRHMPSPCGLAEQRLLPVLLADNRERRPTLS